MDMSNFIVIGENIHCTLSYKADGARVSQAHDGRSGVTYKLAGQDCILPIPDVWGDVSSMFAQGKVQHVALAVWQARNGQGDDRQAGLDYLTAQAQSQIDNGAAFLDVNVDEYSNDPAEQVVAMTWLAGFLTENFDTPLSIDSSNAQTLRAGLECCNPAHGAPLINSVSLERADCVPLVKEFNAEAVVSAAGKEDLPTETEGRLGNFRQIVGQLNDLGVDNTRLHLDPLVFPASTDPENAKRFFQAVEATLAEFPGVHITGGYSNISFGMPNRKLLNMVFTYLCAEHGADSGIINPVHMPPAAIGAMDTASEPFQLAKGVLTGTDAFGMEYITAHRDGRLTL
jgi:5-methyltetrahydrofolate corrinoid/iron sulfur protein methyltransferase